MEKRCALRRNIWYLALIVPLLYSAFCPLCQTDRHPQTSTVIHRHLQRWMLSQSLSLLKCRFSSSLFTVHLPESLELPYLTGTSTPSHFQLSSQFRVKCCSQGSIVMLVCMIVRDQRRAREKEWKRRRKLKKATDRERDGMQESRVSYPTTFSLSLSLFLSLSLLHSIKWKERWVLHTKHLLFSFSFFRSYRCFLTVQCPFLFASSFLHLSIFLMSFSVRKRVH